MGTELSLSFFLKGRNRFHYEGKGGQPKKAGRFSMKPTAQRPTLLPGGSHNCCQVKDCFMNATHAKSQATHVESEGCIRTRVTSAPRTEWRLTGFVCASNWISPQLRGPIGARREEPVPQRIVQPLQSPGPAAFPIVGTTREALRSLSHHLLAIPGGSRSGNFPVQISRSVIRKPQSRALTCL